MTDNQLSYKKITSLIPVCLLVLLLIFNFPIAKADVLEQNNIEEGDAVWYNLAVTEIGAIGVNAWTDGLSGNADFYMYLYDPTGTKVTSDIGYDKGSVTYATSTTGTFKIKIYLDDAEGGGTRNISVSSPFLLSPLPNHKETSINIEEGDAVWYNLAVNEKGVIGVNAWTDGLSEKDNIVIYLYDPTGTKVTSDSGYYNKCSVTYATLTTGTFKIKIYLDDAEGGGTRNISVSSPLQLLGFTSSIPATSTPVPTATSSPIKYDLEPIFEFPSNPSEYLKGINEGTTPMVEFVPFTSTTSIITEEDLEKFLEVYNKEINPLSNDKKEDLANIYFEYAKSHYENGKYEEAKICALVANATSGAIGDTDLIDKIDTLIEEIDNKMEKHEQKKLIYELILALVAALAFGYIFEKKMKKKSYTIILIIIIFLILFFIFYKVFHSI